MIQKAATYTISWFDMWFNIVKPRILFKTEKSKSRDKNAGSIEFRMYASNYH